MKRYLASILLSLLSLQALSCDESEDCVDVGEFQFSVALGGGIKTNPLHGGDNLPLVVIPQFQYYQERFFIDNTLLGYTVYETDEHSVSLVASPNIEKAYFSFWDVNNVIGLDIDSILGSDVEAADPGFEGSDTPDPEDQTQYLKVDDIQKRSLAIDAGVLWNWYFGKNQKIKALWQRDVSNTYQGQHLLLEWNKGWRIDDWQVTGRLGLHWKSSDLLNYYYGVDSADEVDSRFYYQATSGVSSFIGISATKPVTEHWRWLLTAKAIRHSSAMTDSPLVDASLSLTVFIGGVYQF